MAENFREQQQEEAEGIVDAGGFENDPGTGMIAEDQETAAWAQAQSAAPVDEQPQAAPQDEAPEIEEIHHPDLHEDTDSGVDIAVIIVVLLVVIGCVVFAIMNPGEEEGSQQIVAQQQAAQQTRAETKEPPFEVGELAEGIAVVVNGEEVSEDTVTGYIVQFRKTYGLTGDSDWSQWMASMSYTPETVRYEAVQMYANQALVRQAVAELGIEVTQEEIDDIYNSMRAEYATDEEWQQALEESGLTEEVLRKQCAQEAMQAALMEYLGEQAITAEEVDTNALEYIRTYYPEYADATSLDQVDPDIVTSIREMVQYYASQQAYTNFMAKAREEGDIVMSATPANIPYGTNGLAYLFDTFAAQMQAQQAQQAQQEQGSAR